MSDTNVATPVEKAPAPASADNFVSFADALDAGMENLKTSAPESLPAPEAKQIVPETEQTEVQSKTSLDTIADRLIGKEELKSKAQPVVEDDIKTPENLKPEAQTAWARLTKDLRDARTKIKELETKTTLEDTTSVEQMDLKAQLDNLKQERDEYENELKFARLESTKEYKMAVTEPLSIIQKEVSDIAKIYESDPRSIYAAMVEADPSKRRALLKEATSNFDPVDSLAIRQKAEDLQKVFERRELLTKDVQTVLEMLENDEKKEMEQAQIRMKSEIETAYKSEWEALQNENPVLRPIENNEQWNNTLKSIEQRALQIENTDLDPRSKARFTFHAAAMPVIMHVFQDYVSKTQAKINELEKAAKELRSSLPSSGAESGASPEIPSDISFVDALERGMSKR